jgi:uroporphyrinogen-III decarboxylase
LIADLKEAVAFVKAHPEMQGSLGPVYGMSGNVHLKGNVEELLREIMDIEYKV